LSLVSHRAPQVAGTGLRLPPDGEHGVPDNMPRVLPLPERHG